MAFSGIGKAYYCSKACGRLEGKSRRRANTPGEIPPARRWAIFERDKWRCQLCGKLILKRYRTSHTHPWGPTIDHILPVSAHGYHDEANLQAAHRMCNSTKSAGVWGDGEQLRLIG